MDKFKKNYSVIILVVLLIVSFVVLSQSNKEKIEDINLTQLVTEINE